VRNTRRWWLHLWGKPENSSGIRQFNLGGFAQKARSYFGLAFFRLLNVQPSSGHATVERHTNKMPRFPSHPFPVKLREWI
jgi:hypothetical protein